jgi:hypothetical protein
MPDKEQTIFPQSNQNSTLLSNTKKPILYTADNTPHHHYEKQSVNDISGKIST